MLWSVACYRLVTGVASTVLVAELATPIKERSRPMSRRRPSEGRKRTGRWWRAAGPLVAVLAGAMSLAACGGSPLNGVANLDSTTTTSSSSGPQTALAGAVTFANCMRSNGVTNYPDPTSHGAQSLNGINPNSPTFQTAYKVCQKHAPNGEGGPPRALSRPTADSARIRPMHTQARVPAVPGSAHDLWAGLHAGPRGVLSPHQHDRAAVAGVHTRRQGLRSAASLTHPSANSTRSPSYGGGLWR